MTRTFDLIETLAVRLEPVRRLRPPLSRAFSWLLLAVLVAVLLSLLHGPRPDFATRLQDPVFAFGFAAALLTGALAAVSAFQLSLPDRSRLWLLLPLPALAAWVSTIGYGCLTDWGAIGPGGIEAGETARCFATLVLTSLPMSLVLLLMLRHAALVRPLAVCLAGSLAVAALVAAAISIYHPLEASVMILVWNFGIGALIVAAGALFSRRLLAWANSGAAFLQRSGARPPQA